MDLGLYQAEVGRQLGVTEEYISYWEQRKAEPLYRNYLKIIHFLGYIPIDLTTLTLERKLFFARVFTGQTLKEVSNQLGICSETLYLIEKERRKIHPVKHKKIVEYIDQNLRCNEHL